MKRTIPFYSDYFTLIITSQNDFGMTKIKIYKVFAYFLLLIAIAIFLSLSYVYYKYYQTERLYSNYQDLKRNFLQQSIDYKIQQEGLKDFFDKLEAYKVFDGRVRDIAGEKKKKKVKSNLLPVKSGKNRLEKLVQNPTVQNRKLDNQIRNLNLVQQLRRSSFLELEEIIEDNLDILKRTPSIKPLKGGRFSSGFGIRRDPFDGSLQFHKGLDWASSLYTPVFAPADGNIVYAYYQKSYGNILAINHGYGIITRYAHLSKFEKTVGASVQKGEIIARVGNTGTRTTGSHLHYEVIINGKHVDPLSFIINDDTILNKNY